MPCFGCFGPTKEELAAVTIGKVAKGNIARDEAKKLRAKHVISTTPMKLSGVQPTPARFEVKEDGSGLLYRQARPVAELRFAEMTASRLSQRVVKLATATTTYTLTAPSAKEARAFYDSLACFVGKQVVQTK